MIHPIVSYPGQGLEERTVAVNFALPYATALRLGHALPCHVYDFICDFLWVWLRNKILGLRAS